SIGRVGAHQDRRLHPCPLRQRWRAGRLFRRWFARRVLPARMHMLLELWAWPGPLLPFGPLAAGLLLSAASARTAMLALAVAGLLRAAVSRQRLAPTIRHHHTDI